MSCGRTTSNKMTSCQCGALPTLTSSSSVCQVFQASAILEQDDNHSSKETQVCSNLTANGIRQEDNGRGKAATLDGGQRSEHKMTTIQLHHPDCSYAVTNQLARFKRRGSAKLQPSPSSASSHSNTSSLFRDDGFEDDLMSTGSEHLSSSASGSNSVQAYHHQHHRLSFQGSRNQINLIQQLSSNMRRSNCGSINTNNTIDDNDDQQSFRSCEEKFPSNSTNTTNTSASTASNFDDCALSTSSSSIVNQPAVPRHLQSSRNDVLDKITLANAKQQYRKSLLLEHHQYNSSQQQQQQQQHQSNNNNIKDNLQSFSSRIQALATPNLSHLHLLRAPPIGSNLSSSNANVSLSGNNTSSTCHSPLGSTQKIGKSDDRTVNIIGHMPTKNPGYWDSNLSITQRVVTEIIETERTYVDDLEQIVTGYICYLRNVLKQQKQQAQQVVMSISEKKAHEVKSDGHQPACNEMVTTNKSTCSSSTTNTSSVMTNTTTIESRIYDESRARGIDDDEEEEDEEEEDDDEDCEEDSEEINIIIESISRLAAGKEAAKQTELPPRKQSLSLNTNKKEKIVTVEKSSSCSTIITTPIAIMTSSNETTTTGAIITAGDIKKLFSNLEDIYKFNKDLLFRLEECYLNPSSVAECFVENSSGFEVYTNYCTMYPQVVTTLTELMANARSAQLLKERQNELNHCLPLGAYLLKPVQRILKYHILFQSLIKHTSEDETINEKDRQLIQEAFSVMTSIACHINSMKKRHEHAIRVQEVQGLLVGWNGPDLTTLGELILEDTFKLYNRPKSSRHLFLFDNVLLFTKKKRDGTLCYKGHIECSNLMLIEKIEGQPLVFNTVPFDNPKALHSFQAKNLDKKRDWCLQMKEVIIKSFEVKIPVHVRDILMNLTISESNQVDSNGKLTTKTSGNKVGHKSCSAEAARMLKAPNYLEKKRAKQQQLDKMRK